MVDASPIQSGEAPLWSPKDLSTSQTTIFRERINTKHNLHLETYEQLWEWSCSNRGMFWSEVWDFEGVVGKKGLGPFVDESARPSQNPTWFPNASLNWAENQLRHSKTHPRDVALIQISESCPGWTPSVNHLEQEDLYRLVGKVQRGMKKSGLQKGDRVAYWGGNTMEAVVVLLATSSLGGIFSSAAADFGTDGVVERMTQIRPKLLFVTNGVVYNAAPRPLLPSLAILLEKLEYKPEKVIVISHLPDNMVPRPDSFGPEVVGWEKYLDKGNGEVEFVRMGFNEPIWILFSSGTTGKPKAIVHRQGGMLIDSLRESHIAGDIGRGDVYFYYTTPGWMMFQYLVSALATGATVVMYEGSPLKRPESMWETIDELGVTVFGTSAKYIEQISKHYPDVKSKHSLSTLRQILSTGSPLPPHLFDFVYQNIKSDVLLGSITGGTDICSVFAGRTTSLPVYRGEIQARMLGFALDVSASEPGLPGELICRQAFPIEPIGFWPLPGNDFPEGDVKSAQARFNESYFKDEEGNWYHGDYVQITPSRSGNGGGVVMLGRSDGVLNPGGIRFGPTDIYSVLENDEYSKVGIEETLVVGLLVEGGSDEKVILFVKMRGTGTLSEELVKKIKTSIRVARSARHVPARIIQVGDIPVTLTGKKVEVPIRKVINGAPIQSINPATLRNPDCLAEYVKLGEEMRKAEGM